MLSKTTVYLQQKWCVYSQQNYCVFVAKLLCILAKQCVGKGVPDFTPPAAHLPAFRTLYQHHHKSKSIMDTFNLFEDIDITDIVPLIALRAVQEAVSKVPRNTGLSSSDYLRELLNCGNEKRIYSVLRIRKDTFNQLCLWLCRNASLKDSRHILIKEQVAIFLWIINFSASIPSTAERFQHSQETISQ